MIVSGNSKVLPTGLHCQSKIGLWGINNDDSLPKFQVWLEKIGCLIATFNYHPKIENKKIY